MNKKSLPKDVNTKLKFNNYNDQIKVNTKDNLITGLNNNIDIEYLSEKSRTVMVEGKEYTKTISQIFITDKKFKGKNIEDKTFAADNNIYKFKSEFAKIIKSDIRSLNYITGQDIADSYSMEILELNLKIILKIINNPKTYNGSYFEFLKASGLIKLNGNNIDKSELNSCRDSMNNWHYSHLGVYGYIWLLGLGEDGDPRCIRFEENGAYLKGEYLNTAIMIALQK